MAASPIVPIAPMLAAAFVFPAAAQAQSAKFIQVEIQVSSDTVKNFSRRGKQIEIPESTSIRMPVALAKAFLKTLEGEKIKVNGKNRPGIDVDELINLMSELEPGDTLLEVTTSHGDQITVTLE